MSLFKIAWRSILQRRVASSLTTFSMGLGVMMVVIVLSIHGVVSQSFHNNATLGYNMIVGAKGGKLQLTLNTVYYLSQPIENIPYEFYMEFMDKDARAEEEFWASPLVKSDEETRDGKFGASTDMLIPVCLGDYFGRFRVVGTTPAMLELMYDPDNERSFEFAEGRNFKRFDEENGWFECVMGAQTAKDMNVKLGEMISPSHGAPTDEGGELHERKFRVVGILKSSGTPNDRAMFVNMEGFYLMTNHAKDLDGDMQKLADERELSPELQEKIGDWPAPLPVEQREVTAMLIRATHLLSAMQMHNSINEGKQAQAVYPGEEIKSLFSTFVSPIQYLLLALTAMICVVSGVSILVSIYNSMSDRKHEIAVMRALGASRGTVMSIILLESALLSLAGGALGWTMGHAANVAASPAIEERAGVQMGFFTLAPPINVLELFTDDPIINIEVSPELCLIPALILLAIIVGFWPAMSAYRTDVAKALGG